MLNKNLFFLLLLSGISLFSAACQQIPQMPELPEKQAVSATDMEKNKEDEIRSANYHYLEARFHIKEKSFDRAILSLKKAIDLDPDSFILNRDLIQMHLAQKNREKAAEIAEQLAERTPENVNSLLLFVQLKKDVIEPERLVEILQKILTLDPENKETFLRLGQIYMNQSDKVKALELFKRMVNEFPEYYVAWYYLGEIHLFDKQYELAKPAFLKTIELEPEIIEPRFQLVKVYEALNTPDKHKKIEETLNQVIELDPDNHRALLGLGLNHFKSGNKKTAEKLFATLAQDIEKDSALMMTAFDEYISGSNDRDAVIVFSQMLKTNPGSSTLNFFTAIAHQNDNQYEKAISFYQKVAPDHRQYKKAGLSIALLYKEMGQNKTAINFLEDRLKESPKDIDTITYLSSFYEIEKDFDRALELLETAKRYSPENTDLLFRLGALQDKAGFNEKALETMKAIIKIDPDDASALNYLGYTYADKGIFLDEALQLIQRAYDIRPDDGYITDSLGWVYYRLGDLEKAVKYLEKAARLTDYETIIADHLGDAYKRSGRFEKAVDAYEKAIANAESEDDKEKIPEIKKKIEAIKKRIHE